MVLDRFKNILNLAARPLHTRVIYHGRRPIIDRDHGDKLILGTYNGLSIFWNKINIVTQFWNTQSPARSSRPSRRRWHVVLVGCAGNRFCRSKMFIGRQRSNRSNRVVRPDQQTKTLWGATLLLVLSKKYFSFSFFFY